MSFTDEHSCGVPLTPVSQRVEVIGSRVAILSDESRSGNSVYCIRPHDKGTLGLELSFGLRVR